MKRFYIKTLGCKVNQCESEALAAELMAEGWEPAAADEKAVDLCIVNTCTVTARSAMQSRQAIRRCRRENPEALVVAAGCYATVGAEEIRSIGCAHLIVGHQAKHRIPDILKEPDLSGRPASSPMIVNEKDHAEGFPHYGEMFSVASDRARPFLKIQDGCNAFCHYCIVPYARGGSVSMPPREVLSAIRCLAEKGSSEVVLTGIHLGMYGRDFERPMPLAELLRRIEADAAISRVRLSSIEPLELTDEIVDQVAASGMFCDHFHIPLQSGADEILKRMGRPYSVSVFADRVACIKEKLPAAAIGVDVLVGFPGEDKQAFAATRQLISDLPVSYLHVFPFSPRPGTPAANADPQVESSVIKRRCRKLREIGEAKKAAFARSQEGKTAGIMIENRRDRVSSRLRGVTTNYLTVLAEGPDTLKGKRVKTKIDKACQGLRVNGYIL